MDAGEDNLSLASDSGVSVRKPLGRNKATRNRADARPRLLSTWPMCGSRTSQSGVEANLNVSSSWTRRSIASPREGFRSGRSAVQGESGQICDPGARNPDSSSPRPGGGEESCGRFADGDSGNLRGGCGGAQHVGHLRHSEATAHRFPQSEERLRNLRATGAESCVARQSRDGYRVNSPRAYSPCTQVLFNKHYLPQCFMKQNNISRTCSVTGYSEPISTLPSRPPPVRGPLVSRAGLRSPRGP